MLETHKGFAQAYLAGLHALIANGRLALPIVDPLSPASRFGIRPRRSVELIPYGFQLTEPRPSVTVIASRPLNWRYLFGQLVWFLSGSESLDFLMYYNPAAAGFSHDNLTLCGSFGRRIFGADRHNGQIAAILKLLKQDPGSRRAFASVIAASDLLAPTRETPCNCGINFFLRDGMLEVVCLMRAQHALNVLPYDAFLFLVLQQIMASELNVGVGRYVHFCSTFHFYEDEIDAVQKTISHGASEIVLPAWSGGLEALDELIEFEAVLRAAAIANDLNAIQMIVEPYASVADKDLAHLIRDVLCVIALKIVGALSSDHASVQSLQKLGILNCDLSGDTL
ncbi:MAG TPA: thymidylate synthase [Xanthobacteraceae bacterium]|jgi:thymidylate synthase|nr:thymidylate synthase [Xanthobacteraceae bacterium]